MQDDMSEIKLLAIVGVVGVFSTLLLAIACCVLAKIQAQKAQESCLALKKNQHSQILLLEQILERVLELHGSAPPPHSTEAPDRHAGVVESGDRVSQGFEAKLDQKISLILRSLYPETPRDCLQSTPRGARRLGSSPRCAARGRAVYARRQSHVSYIHMYHTNSERTCIIEVRYMSTQHHLHR